MSELRIPENAEIAIAVSGGGDSLALTLLAHEWSKKIIAVTVDHNLREGSAAEARQVGVWLKKYKIKHKILTNRKPVPQSGMMDYARKIRYGLMLEYCWKNKIKYLLTAHNMEDQGETFLMRLERGSGVDGLAAIPAVSETSGVKIIRPLLDFRREELRKYLKRKKQKWIEDPTNKNTKYKRNRLRKLLEASGENSGILLNRLAETAISMRRTKGALETWTGKEIAENFRGNAFLHRHFCQLPEEIGLRILKNILVSLGEKKDAPRFASLMPLYREILAGTLKGRTLAGCKIALKKGKICFSRESGGGKVSATPSRRSLLGKV